MHLINGDAKNKSYNNGRSLRKPVEDLLHASSVNLFNGGGFEELRQFQESFRTTKSSYDDMNHDWVILVEMHFPRRNHFYYMISTRNYQVITELKSAMAKEYIYNGSNTLYDKTHKCDRLFPVYFYTTLY